MLIVDYYSKFITVENLRIPQFETAIKKCKKVFSQFGISKEIITNNGHELSRQKFLSFSKTRDIIHKTISPHYHQRSIQTVKRTFNKGQVNSEDNFLAMLSLNSRTNQNGTLPA